MSKTLEEIRKKLQALDTRKNTGFATNDKTIFPHWNIPEGTSTTIRFLPDANEDNTFFWAERLLFKFPFPGIKGQDEHKPITVQAPCIEMWTGKNTCPVLNEVRPWWKSDDETKKLASKYWVKRTYYMQGFVKNSPMDEQDTPENPIRKFIIGPQIYAIIKAALMDPDMENSPVDYINGTDFIVSKTSKGGYADYGTSKWARKESSITEEMQAAIEQFGLVDLSSYLPKKPNEEQLATIFEMFQASVEGELYDPAKWSQHYKPFGFDSAQDEDGEDRATRSTPAAKPTPKPVLTSATKPVVKQEVVEEPQADEPPFEVDTPKATATTGKSPQEILKMLRERNKS